MQSVIIQIGNDCPQLSGPLQDKLNSGLIQAYDYNDGNWGDTYYFTGEIAIWSGTFTTFQTMDDQLTPTARHESEHSRMGPNSEGYALFAENTCPYF